MTDNLNTDDVADDELAAVPVERLVQMLRDKRKAEAGVRTKLRETETQRDAFAGTVSKFQLDSLHTLAAAGGVLPSALDDLDSRMKVTDVLGDDGLIDPEKVTAALATLKADRPHYFPQHVAPPSSGGTPPTGGQVTAPTASWGDVIGG
ncbi:hypothetical protein E3O45_15100 [Cryobacterium sp. TMS1-20-1]|uniref:hypothetical protein n=1 Tax=Cryobacterium sp. TMS1-20-1 TaxID=1259223 RepID=UPI001069DC5E|nr:hypothetical protein [Cryobacterium sp. TMS1-20-1]TFC71398.1 hypothetical protein E3O45_15100 [Cryobacterium sp. TMS1-20-1]